LLDFYNSNQMALPAAFNNNIKDLHYYQGVLLVEVALTLLFYLILKIVHYVKWGYDEENGGSEKAAEGAAEGEKKSTDKKEGEAEEESESKVLLSLVRNGTKKLGTFTSPSYFPSTLEQSPS
jgi:hypothetical protein